MKEIDNKFRFRLYLDPKDVREGNYIMVACSWAFNRYKFTTGIHLLKSEQKYFLAHNQVIDFNINSTIFYSHISKEDQQLKVHLKFKQYADDIFNLFVILKRFFDGKNAKGELVRPSELKEVIKTYKAVPINTVSNKFIDRYKQFLENQKHNINIQKITLSRKKHLINIIESYNPKIDIEYFNNENNLLKFLNYLVENKYNNNTIKMVILSNINNFLNDLYEKGEIQSHLFNKFIKNLSNKLKTSQIEIVLTPEEIELITRVELPEYLIYSRQLMMIQYYTALRVSDLMKLKPEQIDLTNNVITIYQQKTKNKLIIPIHQRLKPIIEELQGVIKPYSQPNYNLNLRKICKLAGINQKIEVVSFSGLEQTTEIKEKWELIGSHTLRRTAITHALQRGLLPEEAMFISGHKNRRSFDSYVKISREQAFTNFLNKF